MQEVSIKAIKGILERKRDNLMQACQEYGLSLVVLHGSYAKGIPAANSDIDIGLLGDDKIIKEKYFEILKDFASIFGDKFDPVFMNGAEAMILYHIAINGIPLFERRKGLFNSFKLAAIARYMDTKKFRQLERQYIKSAIERMG